MFDIASTESFNADSLENGDEYDYVTRTSVNQGVFKETGFIDAEGVNPAGCWSLGLLQMDFFYRRKPWYAGQFVRKVIPKFKIGEGAALFLTVILNGLKEKLMTVLVRNVDETFLDCTVDLPVTGKNEIDFAFMERFVAGMGLEAMNEIEAYLGTSLPSGYTLTAGEEEALANFGRVKWDAFALGELFEKVKVAKIPFKAKELPEEPAGEFNLPALTAGIQNQGLARYAVREGATVLRDVISISANGANTGATFFQSEDFTVLQDAYAIKWRGGAALTKQQYLFMTAAISKAIYGIYEWTNKAGWERIKNDMIMLPVINGEIDFDFMSMTVSALQKQAAGEIMSFVSREKKQL